MLYKYLPPERVDVVKDLRIRFTQLLSLNDPFEHSVRIGTYEYAMDERRSDDRVKFVSLSRSYVNLLMWSHYAASHTGFCLGFKRSDPYFSGAESVRYRRLRSNFNGANPSSILGKNIIKQIALEKAIDWAYEEEERLFLEDVRQDLVEVGVDGWGRKIILNSYPTISLAKIYIGLRSSDSLIRELVNSLRRHSLEVEVYRASRSVDEFGLSFSLIDQSAYDFIGGV